MKSTYVVILAFFLLVCVTQQGGLKHSEKKIREKIKDFGHKVHDEFERSKDHLVKWYHVKILHHYQDRGSETIMTAVEAVKADVDAALQTAQSELSLEEFELKRKEIGDAIVDSKGYVVKEAAKNVFTNDLFQSLLNNRYGDEYVEELRKNTKLPIVLIEDSSHKYLLNGLESGWDGNFDFSKSMLWDQIHTKFDKIIELMKDPAITTEQLKNEIGLIIEENTQLIDNQGKNLSDRIDNFDNVEYRKKVQGSVMTISNKFKDASEEDKLEIAGYVLAANQDVDVLLRRIDNKKITKRIIKYYKHKIVNRLFAENAGENEKLLEEIMNEIDGSVQIISGQQTADLEENDIILQIPVELEPNSTGTFSLTEVLPKNRQDAAFFEIVPEQYTETSDSEPMVKLTEDSVSVMTPQAAGEYKSKVYLKYQRIVNTDKTESKKFEVDLVFRVRDTTKVNPKTSILTLSMYVLLATTLILVVSIIIVRRKFRKKVNMNVWNISSVDTRGRYRLPVTTD